MPRLLSRLAPTEGMRARRPKPKRRTELGLLIFGSLIVVATYVLASVGTTSKIPANLGPFLGVMLGLALVAHIANRIYAPDANAVLLPIATLLNGLGYVMLARIAQHWAQAQAGWTAVGVGAYIVTLALVRRSRDLDRYRYLMLLVAVVLMLSPLIPHFGQKHNGARLWVGIGPINGQPIELAKLALCIFFASYFVEKRELSVGADAARREPAHARPPAPRPHPGGVGLHHAGARRRGRHRVRAAHLRAVHGHAVAHVGAMELSRPGRGALRGRGLRGGPSLLTGERARRRLAAPRAQRADHGRPLRPGFGRTARHRASGFGNISHIPQVQSDYIFAAFGTEMGLLGTASILFAFMLLIGAGFRTAQTARSEFAQMVASGLTVIIGFQALFIMAGIVRLLPLTGITLPFMAYGGSSLVANYVLIALLMRISDEGERAIVADQATAQRVAPPTIATVAVAPAPGR